MNKEKRDKLLILEMKEMVTISTYLRPHGLYSPWNPPGQNTGGGSLSLTQGSSQPRDQTQVSCIAGRFFTSWATREADRYQSNSKNYKQLYTDKLYTFKWIEKIWKKKIRSTKNDTKLTWLLNICNKETSSLLLYRYYIKYLKINHVKLIHTLNRGEEIE